MNSFRKLAGNESAFLVTNGIVVFTPDEEIDLHYLSTYINGKIVSMMAGRKVIGSTIDHFGFRRSQKILVSVLSTTVQKEIGDLVREAKQLRATFYTLIEESIQTIGELIEHETNDNEQ